MPFVCKRRFYVAVTSFLVILSAPVVAVAQGSPGPLPITAQWQEALALREQLSELPGRQLAFRMAELEVAIGMPARALAVLAEHAGSDSLWDDSGFRIRGEAEYVLGRFEAAALSFVRAAELSNQSERGILSARAGRAFEQANLLREATVQYARAGVQIPQLSGWLAVREASVCNDSVRALRLLAMAAPEAEPLAYRALGVLYVRVGDTNSAVGAFERGGKPARAAELALAVDDSASARRLAYLAIEAEDTVVSRHGTNIIDENFPPRSADEFLELAAASRRLGSIRTAVRHAASAVSAGEPSAETLLYWGDLLAASRSRREALTAYGRAAAMTGEAARTAAFHHGRTLLLIGRTNEGMTELASFVERFPDHALVPRALYGMADRRRRERRLTESDSLNKMVVEGWPRNRYASAARMDLATGALARADTVAAIEWYRAEVEFRGTRRNLSQYLLGSVWAATGDTVAARAIWATLARADSLGYYGTIARTAALLPPLALDPQRSTPISSEVQDFLSTFDLLREAYLDEELELLRDSLRADRSRSPSELLDLAEGLIVRGFALDGIHLGWLASRSYTLNHPRVLRAVFPWPFRDLIEQKAEELELDPYLMAAMIRQESAFSAGAISRAGAQGLMQLMPPTAREVARRIGAEWDDVLLSVPDANLHLGATHLAGLLRHYDQRVVPTLAAYNAGGTPVRRWMRSFDVGDPVQFIENVPYTETRGYLRTVLRNWALYQALYPAGTAGNTDEP